MNKRCVSMLIAVLFLFAMMISAPVMAQESDQKPEKPARGIVAALVYPGVTVGPEDDIRVDLKVKNTGRSSETVMFEITGKPEGWKARIRDYGSVVSGIFLTEDDDRTLTFSAEPEGEHKKLPPGEYAFKVRAYTEDGFYDRTSSLKVKVAEEQVQEESVDLTTSYPVLRGPSDAKFEFSLDVKNDSAEDALFNLSAVAPEGWEVSFKPAYEQKQISSLQIKANQSRQVGVEVTPPADAQAGEFPVQVKIGSGKASAEAKLTVVLTGTYEIATGTVDGRLSVSTQKGKEATMSMFVRNEGSAVQREVSFLTFKPENWEVEFDPEKITELKAGDIKQVEIKVRPSKDALVGDYLVKVRFNGERAQDDKELRVTVRASSAWGWIGVGIIALVIIGLAFTFKALGRR